MAGELQQRRLGGTVMERARLFGLRIDTPVGRNHAIHRRDVDDTRIAAAASTALRNAGKRCAHGFERGDDAASDRSRRNPPAPARRTASASCDGVVDENIEPRSCQQKNARTRSDIGHVERRAFDRMIRRPQVRRRNRCRRASLRPLTMTCAPALAPAPRVMARPKMARGAGNESNAAVETKHVVALRHRHDFFGHCAGLRSCCGNARHAPLDLGAILRRKWRAHEQAQIVVELLFGLHADDDAVDPVLSARIGNAKIGSAFAPKSRASVSSCVQSVLAASTPSIAARSTDRPPRATPAGKRCAHERSTSGARVETLDHAGVAPAPVEQIERKLRCAAHRCRRAQPALLPAIARRRPAPAPFRLRAVRSTAPRPRRRTPSCARRDAAAGNRSGRDAKRIKRFRDARVDAQRELRRASADGRDRRAGSVS